MLDERPKRIVVHRVERDEWLGIPREVFRVDFMVYRGNTCFTQDLLVPAKDELEVYQKFPKHMWARLGVKNIEWQTGANNETTKV